MKPIKRTIAILLVALIWSFNSLNLIGQVIDIEIDLAPIYTIRELRQSDFTASQFNFDPNLTWIEINSHDNVFIQITYETTFPDFQVIYLNEGIFNPEQAKVLKGTNSGFNLLHTSQSEDNFKSFTAWIAYPKLKVSSLTIDYQ